MNDLCCRVNPLYYCGACDAYECKECWQKGHRESHFKFHYEDDIAITCRQTGLRLEDNKTFIYYGK
jgi:hypothetical protein